MAAMLNDVKMTENRLKSADQPSVVVLDSDEEEEETTNELFQRFIKSVQPYLERKEILLLRVKFAEIRPDYASCPTFREMLRRKASQVRKTDVYIHFNDVLKELIGNGALYGRNSSKNNQDVQVKSVGESTSDAKTESKERNTTMAGKFKTDRQDGNQNTPGTSAQSSQSEQVTSNIQIIDLDGQSSSQEFEPAKHSLKNMSKEDQLRAIHKKKRKKKIMKLERKLKYVSDEIKRLSQSELSLEEMELSDSNYIREAKLKEQFNTIWEKICTLKGRPPNTGRVVEQEIKVKSTNFPDIDRAVKKFLKKKKGFPNIFDVRNVVIRANKKHGLGLTQGVLQEIAADIFTDIGNKIQKKRKKDYEYNFGCHLTDNCPSSLDPALNDDRLRRKLDENKKVSESALDNIFRKFVHLGRIKGQDKNDSSADSESNNSSNDEEFVRKKSNTRKRESPDSSDGEDRKAKRAKYRERPTATVTSTSTETLKINGFNNKSCELTANVNLVKASGSASQNIVNGFKQDSIEIIDDDDEFTVISDQQSISQDTVTECINKSQNQIWCLNSNDESVKHTDLTSDIDKSMSVRDGNNKSPNSTKSLNNTSFSNVADKPVNHSNLLDGIQNSTNSSALSNHAKSRDIVENKNSRSEHSDSIRSTHEHEDKEHPDNTQTSEVSLIEPSTTVEQILDNSLVNGNPLSTSKLNISCSKLHIKIQQLRDKKCSVLISKGSKTSSSNYRSEDKQLGNDSDCSDSRHHRRKSAVPHHIQEHVKVTPPDSSVNSLKKINNGKYTEGMLNVSSVTQQHASSSPAVMASNSNKCVATNAASKCSLSANTLPQKGSPGHCTVNSNRHTTHNSNNLHQTVTTSNGELHSTRVHQGLSSVSCKPKPSTSSKSDTIIILSDDED